MKIYATSMEYLVIWFNSDTVDVVGKLVVAQFRDEYGRLRTSNFTVRQVTGIEY